MCPEIPHLVQSRMPLFSTNLARLQRQDRSHSHVLKEAFCRAGEMTEKELELESSGHVRRLTTAWNCSSRTSDAAF